MDDSIRQIQKLLDSAEGNLHSARNLLRKYIGENKPEKDTKKVLENLTPPEEAVIEGVFNGSEMVGNDGQTYQIPPNYASKSKLVEGDVLKLTIVADGSYVFKQIQPVERQSVAGTLVLAEDGTFAVNAGGKSYKVLTASVTFYKATAGDAVTVIIPKEHEASWAVVDNVIPGGATAPELVTVETQNEEAPIVVLDNPQTDGLVPPVVETAEAVASVPAEVVPEPIVETPPIQPIEGQPELNILVPTTAVTEETGTAAPAIISETAGVSSSTVAPGIITHNSNSEVTPQNTQEQVIQPPPETTTNVSASSLSEPVKSEMSPVATDNSNSFQIQYPGGQPTSDEELLAKLKENLANIKKPDLENVSPGTSVNPADTATESPVTQSPQIVTQATTTIPTSAPTENQVARSDQPIAELNI
ncbi:MAG: hypothetical protein WCP14_03210 [bacterium]